MKRKHVFLFVLLVALTLLASGSVYAKGTKDPYKDVTHKKVDAQSYKAIAYIKQYNGWRGLVTKGKLSPNKAMTRREFLVVLHNLYGDKVTVTMADVRGANGKITSKYVCDRMVALSKVLKYPIKWGGTNAKMKRKDVARYIYIFATYNKAFTPKK